MANPIKGEVEFTVDKKVYTLCFSINAMCELEDKFGSSILAVANLMGDPAKISMKTVRTMFWAGLKDHHEAMTEVEAGRLMSVLGMQQVMDLMAKGFTQAFPEADTKRPLGTPASVDVSTGKAH
jgi:tail tube GTA-gp10-like protein